MILGTTSNMESKRKRVSRMFGIREDGGRIICVSCGTIVGKETTKFNFCPKCGAPLNSKGGAMWEEAQNKEKLKLLYAILDESEGKNTEETVKAFIEDLEN